MRCWIALICLHHCYANFHKNQIVKILCIPHPSSIKYKLPVPIIQFTNTCKVVQKLCDMYTDDKYTVQVSNWLY